MSASNRDDAGNGESAHLNTLWAELLVEELVRCGAGPFVLSPGARCIPLTMAVARNRRCVRRMHFDERAAAWYAVGCAKASGRPAVLACTSGSAGANYLPAVVEASQSGAPLIVLTADRPPEMIDAGANQTVRQQRYYGDYLRWDFQMPCPSREVSAETVLTTADQAVHRALSAPPGPVHLNLPFREPLAPSPRVPTDPPQALEAWAPQCESWFESDQPWTQYQRAPRPADAAAIVERLTQVEGPGCILAGPIMNPSEADAVFHLAQKWNWPLFADPGSGIRMGRGAPSVAHFDVLLAHADFTRNLAEARILHFGGPFVSKRLLQHLQNRPPAVYVQIADHPLRREPSHRVDLRVQADVESACAGLAAFAPGGDAGFSAYAHRASLAAEQTVVRTLDKREELTEPGVIRAAAACSPADALFFVGNSMPIRDFDAYVQSDGPRLRVLANRGASGIDGNIATAAGAAAECGRPAAAVIGDLAALHDLSSLSLLRDLPTPFVLVIINNDGGGIFHFLPIAEHEDVFEPYFGTPHGLSFASAAAQFDLAHAQPQDMPAFRRAFAGAFDAPHPVLIEVRTHREENLRIHRELLHAISALDL
jgi:2-succinyl-5-enolpyruvyl-6-hydroxy-3-cyclohexene-1-carboxylate synthase